MANKITKLNLNNKNVKDKLSEQDQKIIENHFKHLVLVKAKDNIIIKDTRYGFELFKSKLDHKYWVYAIKFQEPLNYQKPKYQHVWISDAFIGYGEEQLKALILKVENMMQSGPTGNTHFRDYLVGYDPFKQRIFLDYEPKEWNFKEYDKFQKWFDKNRIKIMAKSKGQLENDDFKNKPKIGINVLLSKLQDPLKRPKGIVTYFTKGKKTDNDWYHPESKKYIVGFLYVES